MALIQNNLTPSDVFSEQFIIAWIKFTDVRPSSQKTYCKAIRQLFKFLSCHSIFKPTRDDIELWKNSLLRSKKASTIQLYIIAAKLFLKFLARQTRPRT